MLKNYLKIAFRNLIKQKSYSLINILGLAMGLTCCLLIGLYILQEANYDRFHEKLNRIYRVSVENTSPEGVVSCANTPFPLSAQLKADYPQIEHVSRIYFSDNDLVTSENKRFFEDHIAFADPDFFQIFSFKIIQGNQENPLDDPASVVLTESIAKKYFGTENPIGKSLQFQNEFDFIVSAVMEDVPVNSHFSFDFVFSGNALSHRLVGFSLDQWGLYTSLYTYLTLPPDVSIDDFNTQIEGFLDNHSRFRPDFRRQAFLTPAKDIYLYSHLDSEIRANNYVSNLVIIGTIGLFVLLIACINFMNLTTARSLRRAREVGVRKVLGAHRSQLIFQFLGESIVLATLAMLIAIATTEFALPSFSDLLATKIDFSLANDFWLLGALFLLTLAAGVCAGAYPAFFLSAYQPVDTLKSRNASMGRRRDSGMLSQLTNAFSLRKILVVTQFALSIMLIVGTMIVQQQLAFWQDKELGFDRILNVSIPIHDDSLSTRYTVVKHELADHAGVLGVSACLIPPMSEHGFNTSAYPNGRDEPGSFGIELNMIDTDFLEHFGLELLAGRNFSENLKSDEKTAFIINETTMKRLGYNDPEAILGKIVPTGINRIEGTIIGVVKDYHTASLHDEIGAVVLLYWPALFNEFSVKIKSENIRETMAHLEGVWAKFAPDYPFQSTFLDEDIARLYEAEMRTSRIIGTFSAIAIFIACLGLFGLAAYTAEQRTKEIGVRKVLGATVNNIVLLLTRDFLLLILIATLIAAPAAYLLMDKWLMAFAYRIDIGPLVFLVAGGLAFFVALSTIAYQAIKAALSNPVDALRYE